MQGYSTSTRELLTYLQELVANRPEVQYRTSDIVHFDYQPANILVHEGRISGVVDWEGAWTGDATFDLATLLYYSWEKSSVREELWRRAVERSGTAVLSVYLAHMILRQVDWSIRFYNELTVRRWLQVSDEVLGRLTTSGSTPAAYISSRT